MLKRQAMLGMPKPDPVPNLSQLSVIESLEAAKIHCIGKKLFMGVSGIEQSGEATTDTRRYY